MDRISIHALREEGDAAEPHRGRYCGYFYPRPPRGGRLFQDAQGPLKGGISIHALREEGDISFRSLLWEHVKFLSTPSVRRATDNSQNVPRAAKFLSTPSARRATGAAIDRIHRGLKFLSTPSARRATAAAIHGRGLAGFLSTPSARRATSQDRPAPRPDPDFYPRPPRGGRQTRIFASTARLRISIHALREEGDPALKNPVAPSLYFYPRPPRGGRRGCVSPATRSKQISIHALREEGDLLIFKPCAPAFKISIHALREEGDRADRQHFQNKRISIHALREEGDDVHRRQAIPGIYFYPRPPRGGRQPGHGCALRRITFLSTPSARRATHPPVHPRCRCAISIHALREEGD